ncbi:MAG: hypothetical protein AAF549_09000 [Pseudomonadota bacterium]
MNERQRMRYEYFQAKGLGVPPTDQEDRLKLANTFFWEKNPRDFETTLMLFDQVEDQDDPDWLFLMANLHQVDPDHPYFDPVKTLLFYKRASDLENARASLNLGLIYLQGHYGSIDINAADFWFRKSARQGEDEAKLFLAELAINHSEAYKKNLGINRTMTHGEIVDAMKSGSLAAANLFTKLGGSGKMPEADKYMPVNKVYEFFSELNPRQTQYQGIYIVYDIMWRHALRVYLGINRDASNSEALEILNRIPQNFFSAAAGQFFSKKVSDLKDIIRKNGERPKGYNPVKTVIKEVLESKIDPSEINIQEYGENIVDLIWCAEQLTGSEGWDNHGDWEELLRDAQAGYLGLDIEEIKKSTLMQGPRYNPISDNGLPVLGVYETAGNQDSQTDQTSYVPPPGIVKIDGVFGNPDGTITFDWRTDSVSPSLILPQDITVALVLAFGDTESPLEPFLSIESSERHGLSKDQYDCFKYKVWNPSWLGRTELGKTLYMADQLIGALCWNSQKFEIGSSKFAFNSTAPNMSLSLQKEIQRTGGFAATATTARVMLSPNNICCPVIIRDGHYHASIQETKMRVNGDYVIRGREQSADIHLNENDGKYLQGRVVNKLTERYNDIATLMPIFMRAEQISALTHSLRELRRAGFMPRAELQSLIESQYEEYKGLPELPLEDRLCLPLPLNHIRG